MSKKKKSGKQDHTVFDRVDRKAGRIGGGAQAPNPYIQDTLFSAHCQDIFLKGGADMLGIVANIVEIVASVVVIVYITVRWYHES